MNPALKLLFFENRSTPMVIRADKEIDYDKIERGGRGKLTSIRDASPEEVAQLKKNKWLRIDEDGNDCKSDKYKKTKMRAHLLHQAVEGYNNGLNKKAMNDPHYISANDVPKNKEEWAGQSINQVTELFGRNTPTLGLALIGGAIGLMAGGKHQINSKRDKFESPALIGFGTGALLGVLGRIGGLTASRLDDKVRTQSEQKKHDQNIIGNTLKNLLIPGFAVYNSNERDKLRDENFVDELDRLDRIDEQAALSQKKANLLMNKLAQRCVAIYATELQKNAGPAMDAAGTIGISLIPYVGGISNAAGSLVSLGGAIAKGKLPDDQEIAQIEEANRAKALIPAIGAHRMSNRFLHAAGKAYSSTSGHAGKNIISESLGGLFNLAGSGLLGAAIGHMLIGKENDGALKGAVGGLGLASLASLGTVYGPSIVGSPVRSQQEQEAHDSSATGNALMNTLVPGAAAYNRMERYRSLADQAVKNSK